MCVMNGQGAEHWLLVRALGCRTLTPLLKCRRCFIDSMAKGNGQAQHSSSDGLDPMKEPGL